MKKQTLFALALAAVIAAPAMAHADVTPGWYAGAGLGASFGIDPTLHAAGGKVDGKNHNVGMDVMANGGYAFANGFRVEGEYWHSQANLKSLGNANAGGHVINNALFANVLYDVKTGTRLTPYVGAGVGPSVVTVRNYGNGGTINGKGDTVVGAYQAIAGVSAQLDKNWAVTADYRYVSSFDPKVDNNGSAGGKVRTENASHNVLVGVRYSFAAPAAPAVATPAPIPMQASAPMVAPKMAAKPVVAPVPQSFMVFFDFNKSTLTPEAKRIIASAAAEFKRGNFVKLEVTGHTDTVGSAAYNQKLSERRAAAVVAELEKLGVGNSSIKQAGVGKSGLMVPTADGVREAQNRRAEIVLQK